MGGARVLGAALALCDRFAIAWDVAEFPHEELVEFARWLAAERLITRGNFTGVFAYARAAPEPAHAQRVAALLASLQIPLAPAAVIVTGA